MPLAKEEQDLIAAVPADDQRLLKAFGVAKPERDSMRPCKWLSRSHPQYPGTAQSSFIGADLRPSSPIARWPNSTFVWVKETNGAKMLEASRAHIVKQGYHVVDQDPMMPDERDTPTSRNCLPRVALPPRRSAPRPCSPSSCCVVSLPSSASGAPPVRIRTAGGTVPISQFIEALGELPAILCRW